MTLEISENDIQWDNAKAYRKSSTLKKDDVRLSDGGEHIVTLKADGAIEREGITKQGDRVAKDSRGQPYIITKEKFPNLYEEDPTNSNLFRSKNHGWAMKTEHALIIKRNDGTTINADAGGYLFKSESTGTVNHIVATEFERSYKPDLGSAIPQTSGLSEEKAVVHGIIGL